MECPGPPQCAAALLDWLRQRLNEADLGPIAGPAPRAVEAGPGRQGLLFRSAPYAEDAPAIRTPAELEGALEHLEYAIFRRQRNQLTRAERARLDNTIDNALFKADRYAGRLDGPDRAEVEARVAALRESIATARAAAEQLKHQAKRADLKLSQLGSLTPEGFEEFVAELFEALGYTVERCGGTGDEGADLRVFKAGLRGIVQCKYHSRGVVGSPELQKFLGSVHHYASHKGFFVTTRTFTLAAERFAADNPIELIDGPRLVELVQEALGPAARREPEPAWF
jgi:restriction system protein